MLTSPQETKDNAGDTNIQTAFGCVKQTVVKKMEPAAAGISEWHKKIFGEDEPTKKQSSLQSFFKDTATSPTPTEDVDETLALYDLKFMKDTAVLVRAKHMEYNARLKKYLGNGKSTNEFCKEWESKLDRLNLLAIWLLLLEFFPLVAGFHGTEVHLARNG